MQLDQYLKQQIEEQNQATKPKRVSKLLLLGKMAFKLPVTLISSIKKNWQKNQYTEILSTILVIAILTSISFTLTEKIAPFLSLEFLPDNALSLIILLPYYFYLGAAVFLLILFIGFLILEIPEKISRKIAIKRFRAKKGGTIHFSTEQYKQAAEILRELKPIKFAAAIEKHGEDPWHILLLSGTIFLDRGKWKRLVSIKAIEEDREAGEEDE